jgi:hypothetical protein
MASGRDIAGSPNPFSRRNARFAPAPGYPAGRFLRRAELILILSVGMGILLSACSSAPLIDSLPSAIGEPAAAPKRAAVAPEFPAVHDTPSPRAAATLSTEEQKKAESELVAARESQKTGTIPPPPVAAAPPKPAAQPAQAAKKKPAPSAQAREAAAGSGQNP